jgi:hypothetical protein
MASPGKKAFALRIDPLLWAEVERLAAQELRSANAQVEYLLREALARRGRLPPAMPATPAPDSESDASGRSAPPQGSDRPEPDPPT